MEPLSHQPHFMVSTAMCGQWLPRWRGQIQRISITGDSPAMFKVEQVPADRNFYRVDLNQSVELRIPRWR